MIYGSVCSGIEAASVAWEPLGWKPAWFSEIESFPSAVLTHRFPHVANLGDMTRIAEYVRAGLVVAPDVLVGGTPCQAFSVAGLRGGLSDPRGALTLAYVDLLNAIDEQRPEDECIATWENVPGILTSKDNAFGCFLAGLAGEDCELEPPGGRWADAGCVFGPQRTIAWRTFDAQYFGVAQRRRRVFVVASARKRFDPCAVLFEFDGLRRDTAPSREAREGIAGTLAGGARKRGGYSHDDLPIVGTLRSSDGGADVDHAMASHLVPYPGRDVAPCFDAGYAHTQGTSGQDLNHGHGHLVPMVPRACWWDGGQLSQTPDAVLYKGQTMPEKNRFPAVLQPVCVTGEITHTLKAEGFDASEDGTGRGQPIVAFHGSQDPCVSEHVTYALGRNHGREACLMQAMRVRRITPREGERLQGFPDDHTVVPYRGKPAADGPRYKAIGNSMAVPCMRWIGQRLEAVRQLEVDAKLP